MTTAAPATGALGARAFLLGTAGLVLVRMCLAAHAPSSVDAHVCLAALALALVAAAPRHALMVAGLVVAAALVSVPTSWDPWISLLALPAALGPAAFFVLSSTGSCRAALLTGLGLGGAANAVAALVQKTVTWPEELRHAGELGLDATTVHLLEAARPLGFSLSPDLCGGLCLAGAFAAFALALELEHARARVGLVAVAAVSASGIFVVRSFGTALALVVGLLVCGALFAARRSLRAGIALGAGGVAAAVVAAAAAMAVRGDDALVRSAGERVDNWQAALAIAGAHPLLGVGFMRFPAAYLAMRTPDANLTRYAHSTPLEILAETGVVGALLVAAGVAIAARALWRRRASLSASDMVMTGAAAAAAVRLCIDYDGHVAQTASIAGVLFGLVVASDAPAPSEPRQQRVVGALAIFALLLTAVLFWRQGVLEGDDDDALASYVHAFPFDVEARLKLGAHALDGLDLCDKNDGCPAAARRAHDALDPLCAKAHPASVALVLRARVLVDEGKLDAALKDIDAALAVDPGNAVAHQLGLSIDRSQARQAAALRWHVPVPD